MDPYEAEEFFKLTEAQRSQLLFVRLKHLEQEVADMKMMVYMEARGSGRNSLPGGGSAAFVGRATEEDYSYQKAGSYRNSPRKTALPFTLPTSTLEQDHQRTIRSPNSSSRPTANDRPMYLQQLIQVDNLCKEEMARMSTARQNLEPLNQLACDWELEEAVGNSDNNTEAITGLIDKRRTRDRDRSYEYLGGVAQKRTRPLYGGSKLKDYK